MTAFTPYPRKYRPLAEILPLDGPLSMLIDPVNACNFKCVFCPTGDAALLAEVARPKGLMDFALFEKLIGDLSSFARPLEVLNLYKDGEPLLHKRLPDMIRLAKSARIARSIETTTNGSLLDAARARAIAQAGLDVLRVSVYGVDDESYRRTTRNGIGFEAIRANVAGLHALREELGQGPHIHCKIIDTGLSAIERQRFADAFGPICDTLNIDSIMGWSSAYERDFTLGLMPRSGAQNIDPLSHERIVCPEPFKTLAVNFDGRVSVCCVDWSFDTVVGDARVESLAQIWNGPALRRFRLLHLEGRRGELKACRDCQYMQGAPAIADLDASREHLAGCFRSAGPGVSTPADRIGEA